jgi:hypothetical protein
MGSHPINLMIRFLLELSALGSVGLWGWKSFDGTLQYLLGLGLPILMTIVWGTFAVLDDPSRSGKAPIPVSGLIRLLIEFVFFAVAVWALYELEYTRLSYALGGIVIIHYLVSYDRVKWLLGR